MVQDAVWPLILGYRFLCFRGATNHSGAQPRIPVGHVDKENPPAGWSVTARWCLWEGVTTGRVRFKRS